MQKHVVDALFRDVSLTAQAINSYDDFVSRIVPDVIKNHRPLELRSEFAPDSPLHIIKLENVRYGVPSCMEKNNDIYVVNSIFVEPNSRLSSQLSLVDHRNQQGGR